MTFDSHWRNRANERFKPNKRTKAQIDFDAVLAKLTDKRIPSDYHFHIHFNDGTSYRVCQRYTGGFRNAASLEFKRCAALACPTDDHIEVPADCTTANSACRDCMEIVQDIDSDEDENYELVDRMLWQHVRTGEVCQADPFGLNLGNLASMLGES